MSSGSRIRAEDSLQNTGLSNDSVETPNESTSDDFSNNNIDQTKADTKIPNRSETSSSHSYSQSSHINQVKNLRKEPESTNAQDQNHLQPEPVDSINKGNMDTPMSQPMIELDSTDTNESKVSETEAQNKPSNASPCISDDEIPISDSEDDFISSDGDSINRVFSGQQFNSIGCGSTFSEHVQYFEKALDTALDLSQLDKSLVAQAKLSGQLNDTNRLLIEKLQELQQSLQRLRDLFNYHIVSKRIDNLDADLKSINMRVLNLKQGSPKSLLFGKSKLGVMDRYPVEYNQARDKVLERPEDA